MSKKTDIQKDMKQLCKIQSCINRKDYVGAYDNCKLVARAYYKPTEIIQSQLWDCITYDAENGTEDAKEYANHLYHDLQYELDILG